MVFLSVVMNEFFSKNIVTLYREYSNFCMKKIKIVSEISVSYKPWYIFETLRLALSIFFFKCFP